MKFSFNEVSISEKYQKNGMQARAAWLRDISSQIEEIARGETAHQ